MSVQDRRDREREQRRQSILDAAEHTYISKGAGATMDDIASAAEVAKGTLYLYFSSKEDLWLSLISKGLAMLEERFRATVREANGTVDAVTRIGTAYIEFAREHTNMFRLLLDSTTLLSHGDATPAILEDVARRSDSLWGVLTGVLQQGIDDGTLRHDISAFEIAIMFWNNTSSLLRLMHTSARSDFRRQEQNAHSLDRLDFLRLIDVSNGLFLEALQKRGAPAH
jgi:AcrR family transcriptional regulator